MSLNAPSAFASAGRACGANLTGPENSFFAFSMSVGISMTTGPGRPLRAQWNPSAITSGISSIVRTSRLHLVSESVTTENVGLLKCVGADHRACALAP